jgi:hypothetical protein
LVQVVRRPGIEWEAGEGAVETLFGDPQWTNYSASAQIAFRESFSSASVLGRVNSSHRSHQAPDGYVLTVHSSGAWELLAADRILASGIFPSPSNRPLSIQLRMKSNRIEASVEGTTVAAVNDGTYAHGQAGVGTSYNRVEISRVAIE